MLSQLTGKLVRGCGIVLSVILLLCASNTSRAQANECPFDPNKIDCGLFEHTGWIDPLPEPTYRMSWACDKPYEVRGFDLAPCTGLLVPHDQADEAIKLKLVDFPALQDEFRLYRVQAAIDLKEAEDALKIEQEKNVSLNKLLDRNLVALEPPFYDTFWFGASVGVVTTVIIVVAVAYAVAE